MLTILENNDISFEHLPSGIDTVCVIISEKQLEGKMQDLLYDIEKRLKPDSIDIYQDMALIATVGLGMSRRLGRIRDLVRRADGSRRECAYDRSGLQRNEYHRRCGKRSVRGCDPCYLRSVRIIKQTAAERRRNHGQIEKRPSKADGDTQDVS